MREEPPNGTARLSLPLVVSVRTTVSRKSTCQRRGSSCITKRWTEGNLRRCYRAALPCRPWTGIPLTDARCAGSAAGRCMRRAEFDRIVRSALKRVPEVFRAALQNVQIVVKDWPDPDLMEEMTGERDAVVYGLFTGRALTERHYDDWGDLPAVISIYQGPLEEDFPDRKDLEREIEITLVHEIAHYMGINEDTLASYGYG